MATAVRDLSSAVMKCHVCCTVAREIVPSSLLDNSHIFATVWRCECGAAGPPVVIVSTGSCSVTELGAGARTRSQGTYFAMECKYYGSKNMRLNRTFSV